MRIYDAEEGRIRIALAGDAMITRAMRPFREPAFLQVRELLHSADARIANLEMLFHSYTAPPTSVPGGTYMQADPALVDDLMWLGINAVCAANNHSFDFGEQGILEHLEVLERAGLPNAGLGADLREARAAAYLDTPAGRVAVIGVTSSGPQALAAEHRWAGGRGRPGASMLRYTTEYTVPRETFEALRSMHTAFDLTGPAAHAPTKAFADLSYGASLIPDSETSFYLGDFRNRWQYPVPAGVRVILGDDYRRRFVAVESDVQEILQSIRDSREMADWVVVSMHNHEPGETEDDPSEMVEIFARQCIDAGADIFHGHGPHRDRGIEIYNGRPIFYSIGHFIVQNDTIQKVPRENMIRQGADQWTAVPSDFFTRRGGREREGQYLGSALNPAFWRDFVAVVEFDDWKLAGISLHPIDLGFGRRRTQRGRPVIASQDVASEVVALVRRLSKAYGTAIEDDGATARVAL